MINFIRKNFIYAVVAIISILLLGDIVLTYYNNSSMRKSRELQQEAETIKLYTEQVGKSTIHGIDIGLRGYTILREERFFSPVDSAFLRKDSILKNIEVRLLNQRYPAMSEFYALRDSLNNYFVYCFHLKTLLDQKKDDEFLALFTSDKGLYLWLQYIHCQKNIADFEDRINAEAQEDYDAALQGNHILQIVLFLICFPTLLYTAYYTTKTVGLSNLLRQAEADKNKLLTEQNEQLEVMVVERTKEISKQNDQLQAQGEEIAAQRDILALQNKRLIEAQEIIEEQNKKILAKNDLLEDEVSKRTEDLQNANEELIRQNNQLEQFAFMTAHNLRAPLARILGLANILKLTQDPSDHMRIMTEMVTATRDMDAAIHDLNAILDIDKHTSNIQEVKLQDALTRVIKALEREISETRIQINTNFTAAQSVMAVQAYIESILFNLISNSIKYRNPEVAPVVMIETSSTETHVCLRLTDNGLGIDLNQHRDNIFNLYKRFHLHTEGKGLGLYLIKTQMQALGGDVEVDSQPLKGATFTLYFRK